MNDPIRDAFDRIRAPETLKASTASFLREETAERRHSAISSIRWRGVLAACVLFTLFAASGGYYTINTPVSYVSIDVNPSLELTLNRFDRVVSAAAYGKDAEAVLDGVSVKGLLYTEAIDKIVDSTAMRPYLTENSALTFTVAANDAGKQADILAGIENCSGHRQHTAQSYAADIGTLDEAHGNGLSFGKYAAYLVLAQYDSAVTAEDCRNMSMWEIHSQISAHGQDGQHNRVGGHGSSGAGHRYGHGAGE